tara:strand:+ start:152 stop:1129 length:978 start_codon:yes stop_codon:yes gene_type:complete
MKIIPTLLFLLTLVFSTNLLSSDIKGKVVNDMIGYGESGGRILGNADIQMFLEGKHLYGYFASGHEFEFRFSSLEKFSTEDYYRDQNKGNYSFITDGEERKGKWWIDDWDNSYNFISVCFELLDGSPVSFLNNIYPGCWALLKDDNPADYFFIFPLQSRDKDTHPILAKITKIIQHEEGELAKSLRLKKEKDIAEKKAKDLEQKNEYEKNKQSELKSGVKLVEAYINYLIIKNLNDRYGSESELDKSRKLIKSIEDFYAGIVEQKVDTLWNKAKTDYENNYASSINELASFFSSQGSDLFKLANLDLQNHADEVGISSSDTEKDF